MPEFIYMFGYEDVDEHKVNQEADSDYESAGFFTIQAETPEAALEWGRVLSDWYVAKIFEDEKPGRWSKGEFASWIEQDPRPELREALDQMASVAHGQYPDLSEARRLFYD